MVLVRLQLFLFVLLVCPSAAPGQIADPATTKRIAAAVQLDSVVITAVRQGFDVDDFIRLVQNDESLYAAFRNLRTHSHRFDTQIRFFNKHGESKAEYTSNNHQVFTYGCREMSVENESVEGNYFKGKKRKYRYYTARLYDRVFVTHGRVCTSQVAPAADPERNEKTEQHISELKKLIFTPGRQANVPLIGRKTEIFSDKMLPLYDFFIRSTTVQGIPVYEFEARVKSDYVDKEGATVFKTLTTHFRKSDFQVVGRRYHLAHRNILYMFDVKMDIEIDTFNGMYFPTLVTYDGQWNVPGRKKEVGTFTVRLHDFK